MRGRWTKTIPATSASGADVKAQVMEWEMLEDEVDLLAMKDQRGDTEYPYKVSIGVSRRSYCEFARTDLCH